MPLPDAFRRPRQTAATRYDAAFTREIRSRYFRGIEFATPAGDPGWFGPGSATWYVHSHMPAIVFGLFAAAYIEGLDPSIGWMGHDHSRIPERASGIPTGRIDAEGAAVRLGHSVSFFTGTAFASTRSAERLARTVRAMHHTVKGTRPDGLRYDADDPEWLRWNYATVVWGLATVHERYHHEPLRGSDLEGYYAEFVRVGEALGGTALPATKQDVLDCLESYLPKLAVGPIKAFGAGPNIPRGELKPWEPGSRFMDWAARDMLPGWGQKLMMHRQPPAAVVRARRASLKLALNGLHKLGPLAEAAQAQARVAGGHHAPVVSTAPTAPDPVLSRDQVESMA